MVFRCSLRSLSLPTPLSITIGRDGVVSVTQQGATAPVQVGQLNLTTFMNDTGLESIGENLYTETQSSGAPNSTTPGLNGAGLLYRGMWKPQT